MPSIRRRRMSEEFKEEAVRLLETDPRPSAALARELGVERAMLYRWRRELRMGKKKKKKSADVVDEPKTEKTTEELLAENKELRQRIERLEMEKAILKKATAFFAKESE
jgi:transposase